MPLSNLTADAGIGEPQRVNNALLYIAGLGGHEEETITLSLSSFPLPKRNIGIIEVGHLNEKRKFAGNPQYDDLTLVFNDYVDKPVARSLWKWHYQVHNPETGKTGLAVTYKKRGWVTMFAPDGSGDRQYDLLGIWPSTMDPGEIDQTGEDTVKITVNLTIDKCIPTVGINPE